MPEDEPDAMGLGVPPPVVYLGPLLLGLLLGRRFPLPFLPRRSRRILGLPLVGGGVLIAGWTFRKMKSADTPIVGEPLVPGKPTTTLITDGPFRHSRNPGYLAAAMVYAGIAGLANAPWPILLLPVTLLVMRRTAIEREESYLEREFGDEYLDYKGRVRRWI